MLTLSPSKHSLCGTPENSVGSTSLLVFMSAIGVVLNVDRESRKKSYNLILQNALKCVIIII